ncbi:DNA mismatch repair protein MSH6 [Carica papaya]|uniref:DNA mismatch repair protein MSH6 n=1 Tax=Carica papaya TaxID=3649 RepID=UPI000B8D1251|nr:DNA mismatch repair protein MSH6 [Carica papaya]
MKWRRLVSTNAELGVLVRNEPFNSLPRLGRPLAFYLWQAKTFLVELSETAFILQLLIHWLLWMSLSMTAISDGQAILESLLEHFVNEVQCKGMFLAHYH